MAAYRRVYDSRHLRADCHEPGSAPEPYATLGNRVRATFYSRRIRFINIWRNRQLSMSVVALVRIVCFAVFLLRLFNFCSLYKFSATMQDGKIKLYVIIRSSCMLTYLLFLSPCADRRRDDGNKPVADGGGRCLDNNDAGAARGWISSQTGQRRRGL